MKKYKNGVTKFDADDLRALFVPPENLTEGQIEFLKVVARSEIVKPDTTD